MEEIFTQGVIYENTDFFIFYTVLNFLRGD